MNKNALISELTYKAVRSSGSGGQHVNKVATKVELYFNILKSQVFDDLQKDRLSKILGHRINKNGILVLSCGRTPSQLKNKVIVTQQFFQLLEEGLKENKDRIPTAIPRGVKQKRLHDKRKISDKKANRKPPKI